MTTEPVRSPSAASPRDEGHILDTDAVVIGAGPVGLFQVFQLGLQEIKAHVIDALPNAGGQCVELYGDKPIYDIPGIDVCTGRELSDRLLRQIAPFDPSFHFGQLVSELWRDEHDGGHFHVRTSVGTALRARAVFIAAGAGAFMPRHLKVPGLQAHDGAQLHYHPRDAEAMPLGNRHVVIVGGDDLAVEAALKLGRLVASPSATERPASVVLMHRREVLQASDQNLAELQALREAKAVRFIAGQLTGIEEQDQHLSAIEVSDADDQTCVLPANALLVYLGLSPKLGPLADWGLALERKQLMVDTEGFSTSVPGIFAVGDVNTYPGKRKLILCGFHESTLAAFAAVPFVFPGRKAQLQYTTTSPRLHRLLGVAVPRGE